MSLCLRYVDASDAKDILQLGFIKVFDYIHQFKGTGSFEGWIRKVFVSIATRHLANKKIQFAEIHDDTIQIPDEQPGVIEKISEDEIHQLIRTLPVGYRTVFNMYVIEGYSHEEIGSMLNIEPVTSRSQLLKARKLLQVLICKHCNTVLL